MLNKKAIWVPILLMLIFVMFLSGCSGIVVPPETAKMEITFDPNPVPCEDGHQYWDVIISEINGIGVNLKTETQDIYVEDQKVASFSYDEAWMQEHLGSSYLPAFSSMVISAGSICEVTHEVFTFTGVDDNGHEVQAIATIDL